ncbi:nitroreductase family protein [Shewanella baltica]|uniref:nitroreductase family protein n=1 Tax=Shewanella baltica TaxID=62322 RepID=UPI000DFDE185|nr:nitroreductase family protein [Shewanella baltica]SUI48639.1 5,6-dimethylbenzimidazole synthase [Shewanella baltica]
MNNVVKMFGRLLLAFNGFLYDWIRFVKYNGWRKKLKSSSFRDYYNAKLYHTLEKSLSYKEQKINSGLDNSKLLLSNLSFATTDNATFHDIVAAKVLKDFCSNKNQEFTDLLVRIPELPDFYGDCGAKTVSLESWNKSRLAEPELFFFGRSSLREYSDDVVEFDIIERALKLANKTPSSCNMQPWHTYLINNQEKLKAAIDIQSGNRGFGDKIKGLLIITVDQTAFISSSERYQHWIDGGMYSMSVVYALHSLGVASCCLNWSEDPRRDKLLRKTLGIKNEHSIMMMISYGWPDDTNKVCVSPRKPIESMLSII